MVITVGHCWLLLILYSIINNELLVMAIISSYTVAFLAPQFRQAARLEGPQDVQKPAPRCETIGEVQAAHVQTHT